MPGVLYFNRGKTHLALLVASIYSLRRHYDGPVLILDTGESSGAVDAIAGDKRLYSEVATVKIEDYPKNSCYVAKASLWRHSPFDATLFLDADTLVVAGVETILRHAKDFDVTATQFSNWTTGHRIVSGRLKGWLRIPGYSAAASTTIHSDSPAINTGVIGWRAGSPFLPLWEAASIAGHSNILTDEIAAQICLSSVPRHCVLSDRWNCSPVYGKTPQESVKIWHFHGGKHLSRDRGRLLWGPTFRQILKENVADILGWPECRERDAFTAA